MGKKTFPPYTLHTSYAQHENYNQVLSRRCDCLEPKKKSSKEVWQQIKCIGAQVRTDPRWANSKTIIENVQYQANTNKLAVKKRLEHNKAV